MVKTEKSAVRFLKGGAVDIFWNNLILFLAYNTHAHSLILSILLGGAWIADKRAEHSSVSEIREEQTEENKTSGIYDWQCLYRR